MSCIKINITPHNVFEEADVGCEVTMLQRPPLSDHQAQVPPCACACASKAITDLVSVQPIKKAPPAAFETQ